MYVNVCVCVCTALYISDSFKSLPVLPIMSKRGTIPFTEVRSFMSFVSQLESMFVYGRGHQECVWSPASCVYVFV